MTMEELSNVQGRAWEDVDVSAFDFSVSKPLLTVGSIDVFADEVMRMEAIEGTCCIPLSPSGAVQGSCHVLL
jgi:hypothetical protein